MPGTFLTAKGESFECKNSHQDAMGVADKQARAKDCKFPGLVEV